MKDNYIEQSQLLTDSVPEDNIEDAQPRFRRPRRIFKKKRRLVILLLLAGLIIIGSLTVLGFMLYEPEQVYDDSAAFYFSSNLLSEEGGEFTVYDDIEFNVYNYADSLRVSKEPLESFSVKVEADGKDITGKSEISTGETAMAPDVRSGCTVVVSVPEEYCDAAIDVTVTSSPIEKVLRGTFTVKPEWGYELSDNEGDVCAELIIFANEKVTVEVEWDPEALIADSTNAYVRAAQGEPNICTVELDAGMSASIPMFKISPEEEYDSDSKVISVKKTENAVVENEEADTQPQIEETEEVA